MANALVNEKSPYLLQHADNPVDWLPWGEAAFAKARAEQKPIFLSIGYSTCHWCHVMAHESFEDATIAALLNEHFISIKVDREERPDVDKVYMTYVQAMTGHGGWPLSAWLTPELKPFYGGTYFPPSDRPGRTGFPAVLNAIADSWAREREKLVAEGNRVIDALVESTLPVASSTEGGELHEAGGAAFEKGLQFFYENYDAHYGGFGGAPKFPRASNLDFLFRCAVLQGVESEIGREAVSMAASTLQRMAAGGLHDPVGGGFHRYSVDERWFVPHFEKMLYDQAQIATNALDAFLFTGHVAYAWLARDIFDYVARDLTHPAGGFYSAEDADSEEAEGRSPEAGDQRLEAGGHAHAKKKEGAFYVWTRGEIEEALGEEAPFFCDHFGVRAEGNVSAHLDPHGDLQGKNILAQQRSILDTAAAHRLMPEAAAEKMAGLLERLRAVRAVRPRPHRDDKIISAWNGLMISALARGAGSSATCLADKRAFYRGAAERAAIFVERELFDAERGVLYRNFRGGRGVNEGFAEDYAFMIAGLLDLYEETFATRWLRWAERLQQTMDRLFWDETGGGYFNSAAGDTSIVLRLKEDYDGAEPSPNSVAAANLLRLAAISRDGPSRQRAERTIEALRRRWSPTPHAMPAMLCAIERALEPPRQVVLAGDPLASDFQALAAATRAQPGPRRTILATDAAPWAKDFLPMEGKAAAYVCEDGVCQLPVTSAEALRRLLKG